jgi:hypothetical protein
MRIFRSLGANGLWGLQAVLKEHPFLFVRILCSFDLANFVNT